jgi:hypothetical protein
VQTATQIELECASIALEREQTALERAQTALERVDVKIGVFALGGRMPAMLSCNVHRSEE